MTWECSDCSRKNRDGRFCAECGSPRNPALSRAARETTEEWIPPWRKPGWVEPLPTDRCTESGCTKTAQDHIEEFRGTVSRPGTLFTRAKPEPTDEHAERIRRQAAMLRAQAERVPF